MRHIITVFQPTKQRQFNKNIYGFDIETYDKNKKFLCASIYSENKKFCKTFFTKQDCIDYFKLKRFNNSVIASTNLSFDFIGTFFRHNDIYNFDMLWRDSNLIYTSTYIKNHKFMHPKEISRLRREQYEKDKKRILTKAKKIIFLDTLNYSLLSVAKWGKILKLPKLVKPEFLGKKPKNKAEWDILIEYNMRDCEISQKTLKFLIKSFMLLGSSFRNTIASSSMSLYKNKYLYHKYYRHTVDKLLNEFKAYYGGRVEAIARGEIKHYNYYDFNSLYPSVMINAYPDPNTMRQCYKNTTSYIENFEGISEVDIYCPEIDIPLLPYRVDDKLLFPHGSFRGWYSHLELRKAMELGYVIKRVYKTYYFKDICYPFKDFIINLYELRRKYQKDNNPMEYVVKIMMNSLYGKFGQKFQDMENWIPIPKTLEEIHGYDYVERIGDFMRIKKTMDKPRNFCIPIWALYVTAYGRLKLYDWIIRSKAIYYDTDSLITKKEYEDSSQLGALKKEMKISQGVIVKPKFYGIIDDKGDEYVKIKGLGVKISYDEFLQFIQNPSKTYIKFMRFKESVRRGFIPNELQPITKTMTLEDNKRLWPKQFSFRELQESKPLEMTDEIYESQYIIM